MTAKKMSIKNGRNVSLAECECISSRLKSKNSKATNSAKTNHPSHVAGVHPHPYVFALNQSLLLIQKVYTNLRISPYGFDVARTDTSFQITSQIC